MEINEKFKKQIREEIQLRENDALKCGRHWDEIDEWACGKEDPVYGHNDYPDFHNSLNNPFFRSKFL